MWFIPLFMLYGYYHSPFFDEDIRCLGYDDRCDRNWLFEDRIFDAPYLPSVPPSVEPDEDDIKYDPNLPGQIDVEDS